MSYVSWTYKKRPSKTTCHKLAGNTTYRKLWRPGWTVCGLPVPKEEDAVIHRMLWCDERSASFCVDCLRALRAGKGA